MIKPTFTRADIAKSLKQNFRDKLYRIFLRGLRVVGEKAVAYARSLNTYTDQTGNLRSSIGYAIYHDGMTLDRNFKKVADGSNGVSEGERHAARKIPPKGFALVVVAGMDYALAVESRGYDVLSGSELLAEKELEKYMNAVREQIDKWVA